MTLFNFINLVIAYGIILLEIQKADKHCNAHRRLEEKHLSFLQKRKISIKLKNKDMKKNHMWICHTGKIHQLIKYLEL